MGYYNFITDYLFQDTIPIVEPVTLAEAKNYCRVTTSADDALIELMITQAREAMEKATGLSLIPRQVEVWFNNTASNFELPFGPVTYFMQLIDEQGNYIDAADYKLIGGQFPKLQYPKYINLTASYLAGGCCPKDLKLAILDQVSYDYENRGLDANTGICEKAWRACQRNTRISPLL